MNHLKSIRQLSNQYLVMRHGESIANQQGIIISDPKNGVNDYGLSEKGCKQIENSINSHDKVMNVTKVISSDFLRAFESATIAQQLLQTNTEIEISKNLRERFFGDHELRDNRFYQVVWDDDALDSSHTINNAESADAVTERATALVMSLEKKYKGEVFLFVSHGDTLQILQTAFDKKPASLQRSLPHLENAEIRELVLTV